MNGLSPQQIQDLLNEPNQELKAQIAATVLKTITKIEDLYQCELIIPNIVYDLKGQTAGWAVYATNSIRINTTLAKNNTQDYLDQTVPHEVAHIACYQLFPQERVSHGPRWQIIMLQLGLSPERCHNYEVTPVRKHKRPYIYVCDCGAPHRLTSHKHNKIERGARYTCVFCRSILFYSHTEE